MNAKNNRLNHDFQIEAFLCGSCHTVDGKYALLIDLEADRVAALNHARICMMERDDKMDRYKKQLGSFRKSKRREARIELLRMELEEPALLDNISAAVDELAFIRLKKAEYEPLRKYKHLSIADASEALQREEWMLEIIHRCENLIACTGGIDTETLRVARTHPDFADHILPKIDQLIQLTINPTGGNTILTYLSDKSKQKLVKEKKDVV